MHPVIGVLKLGRLFHCYAIVNSRENDTSVDIWTIIDLSQAKPCLRIEFVTN